MSRFGCGFMVGGRRKAEGGGWWVVYEQLFIGEEAAFVDQLLEHMFV